MHNQEQVLPNPETEDATVTQVGDASGSVSETADGQGRRTEVAETATGDTAQVDAGTQAATEDLEAPATKSEVSEDVQEEPLEGAEEESPEADDVTPETPASSESNDSSKGSEDLTVIMDTEGVRERADRVKAFLRVEGENQIQAGIELHWLAQKLKDASFRALVTKGIGMEQKKAYYLRSAGKAAVILMDEHGMSIDHLVALGVSKLVTLGRFPDKHWKVKQGEILVPDGNTEARLPDISNDKLRQLLQAAKAEEDRDDSVKEVKATLGSVNKLRLPFEIRAELQAMPSFGLITTNVKKWTKALEEELELRQKAINDARKTLDARKNEWAAVNKEKGEADWWLVVIEGRELEPSPEYQAQRRAEMAQTEAEIERRQTAEIKKDIVRNRRTVSTQPLPSPAQ